MPSPNASCFLQIRDRKHQARLSRAFRDCSIRGRDVDLLRGELCRKFPQRSTRAGKFNTEYIAFGVRKPGAIQGFLGFVEVIHDRVYGAPAV